MWTTSHRPLEDLRGGVLRVNVRQDHGRVVAAELERYLLQGGGAGRHDLLAGRGRAGEGNLRNLRVLYHHLAELVTSSHNVHHTGRECLNRHLREHGSRERRVRGGLHDDGVARDD